MSVKHLVLLSGGLDSTVMLAHIKDQYPEDAVTCVTINYGQKHHKEIDLALKIAAYYKCNSFCIPLAELFNSFNSALLMSNNKEIQNTLERGEVGNTYVPFRNGIFLSVLAGLADSHEYKGLWYGAHAEDASNYPDCSKKFYNTMKDAIFFGTANNIVLTAPWINMYKAEIVAKGRALKVPFGMTWSCYNGREKACGVCPTCKGRLEAFKANGIVDPLVYVGAI